MAMPETAMHEDDLALAGKHQIRLSRQRGVMQSIPKPRSVKQPANEHLGPGILALHPRHDAAALNRAETVNHAFAPRALTPHPSPGAGPTDTLLTTLCRRQFQESAMTHPATNWFDQGGQAYARFRPQYPAALAAYLASIAPDTALAVDVGCGNGQLTHLLAEHFTAVAGFDPSADQLAPATTRANVTYQCAPAERLPLPDRCASLISAAQAAHWFDLPAFYAQVRRIAKPGAVVALISY